MKCWEAGGYARDGERQTMKRPQLFKTCPCCDGKGNVEVTGALAETWHALNRYREISAATLAKELHCQATAANNRLAKLEEVGLAKSRRYGRERLFRAFYRSPVNH